MIDRAVGELERATVLHPILIALYPLVSIYATNVGLMSPHEILWPAATVLVGTLAVGAAAWLLTRNIRTGGYLTSLFLILFFGFERAVEALQWADPVFDLGDRRRTVLGRLHACTGGVLDRAPMAGAAMADGVSQHRCRDCYYPSARHAGGTTRSARRRPASPDGRSRRWSNRSP